MTSPAVDTGIVAFIEARRTLTERWARDALDPMASRNSAYLDRLAKQTIADVAKDRAILALHYDNGYGDCRECQRVYPCQTVRLLAATDADHTDYRPDWKPVAT